MQRLAEIGVELGQQVNKIAQAYTDFQTSGEFPPDLRELFLDVADLARAGAAELEKIQLDSPAAFDGTDTRGLKPGEGWELWEFFCQHIKRLIVEQLGAVVVITAEDTPEGGLKSNSYTFFGEQFKSLKAFANLLPEMTQEAEAKLRREFLPDGPVN